MTVLEFSRDIVETAIIQGKKLRRSSWPEGKTIEAKLVIHDSILFFNTGTNKEYNFKLEDSKASDWGWV